MSPTLAYALALTFGAAAGGVVLHARWRHFQRSALAAPFTAALGWCWAAYRADRQRRALAGPDGCVPCTVCGGRYLATMHGEPIGHVCVPRRQP